MRGRPALVALLALLALLASPGTSVAAAPSGGVRTSAARRWLQKRGGAIDDAIVIPFDDAAHHALDDDVDARAAEWKKNHTAPPPSPLAPPAKNPSDGPVGARVETCKPRAVAKAKRCHYVRHNPACSKDENIGPPFAGRPDDFPSISFPLPYSPEDASECGAGMRTYGSRRLVVTRSA